MTSTASPRWRLPLSLLVAALVALVLACGGGDESPDEPAPATEAPATEVATAAPTSSGDEAPATEAPENGASSGQPRETQAAPAQRRPADAEDLRYVREVCLAGDVFDAAIEDVMEELGVDLETGEGVDDVSDEDMAEVLDALIPPMEELVAALQAIAPPPHAREFHEDAVAEWGAVTLSLASLLSLSIEDEVDPRAGLQRLVAILLEMQEALANTAIAPEALRSRLLSLEDDVPECASTDFLTTFLGPPPLEGQIDPVDEQYLRDVCAPTTPSSRRPSSGSVSSPRLKAKKTWFGSSPTCGTWSRTCATPCERHLPRRISPSSMRTTSTCSGRG